MDYKEFISYMDVSGTSQKDAISGLQSYVQEFPYFQTAQALLAKAMREQEHVRFDKQLKIAAAYCGDRKSLYALINHKPKSIFVESNPESPFISPSAIEVVSDESPFIEKPIFEIDNSTFQEVDEKPIPIFEPVFSNTKENNFDSIHAEEEDPTISGWIPASASTPASGDPHDIIRERLKEILRKNEKSEPENIIIERKDSTSTPVIETEKEESVPSFGENVVEALIDNHEKEKVELSEERNTEVLNNDLSGNYSDVTEDIQEKIQDTIEVTGTPIVNSKIEVPEENNTGINASHITGEDPEEIIQRIAKESENRNDEVDLGELEYALESTIIHSLENLPLLEGAKKQKEEVSKEKVSKEESVEPRTFMDWLKQKQVGEFGKIEEVHAYEKTPDTLIIKQDSEIGQNSGQIQQPEVETEQPKTPVAPVKIAEAETLIDKFIATEPRIVPSKTEFYSPAKQAQKSLIEHEDLVSETLAKIYSLQGAHLKARSAYQKLMLLHPEKKAYFAALIEEIDNSYNNPDKQDL